MNARCIASAVLALACAFHAFARVDVKIDLHSNADGMRDVGHANFLGRNVPAPPKDPLRGLGGYRVKRLTVHDCASGRVVFQNEFS